MPAPVSIRQETRADHVAVGALIEGAFATLEISDQTEHLLVERLRTSPEFVPELSLVAERDGQICGHILFTRVQLADGQSALSLAPLSVLPEL